MARVAFIGLGVMGYPMAGHLAAKGHEVTVYCRRGNSGEDRDPKEHLGMHLVHLPGAPLRIPSLAIHMNRDLYDKGEPVDSVTLVDELQHRGKLEDVGGALTITTAALRPDAITCGAPAITRRCQARCISSVPTNCTASGKD